MIKLQQIQPMGQTASPWTKIPTLLLWGVLGYGVVSTIQYAVKGKR